MNSAAGEGYLATPAVATIAQWAQMANWETIERRFTMQLGRIATFTGLSPAAGFRAYSAPIACFAYEDQRDVVSETKRLIRKRVQVSAKLLNKAENLNAAIYLRFELHHFDKPVASAHCWDEPERCSELMYRRISYRPLSAFKTSLKLVVGSPLRQLTRTPYAGCGGIFDMHLTANLLRNLPVKKNCKSVKIWQNHDRSWVRGPVFGPPCVYVFGVWVVCMFWTLIATSRPIRRRICELKYSESGSTQPLDHCHSSTTCRRQGRRANWAVVQGPPHLGGLHENSKKET